MALLPPPCGYYKTGIGKSRENIKIRAISIKNNIKKWKIDKISKMPSAFY